MSLNKVICVPDIHAPYHDEKALALVDKVARDFRPRDLIQIGDLGDMYQVSAFGKDHDRLPLNEEIAGTQAVRALLDSWDSLRSKRITLGNHEDRWDRWLQNPKNADELERYLGIGRDVTVSDLFKLEANGWEVTAYRDHTVLGKVHFTHDVGTGGKFATNAAGETFGHSVVIGHHHAMQMFVLGNAVGERWGAWQFGWLGDLGRATYEHRIKKQRQWTLGFGVGIHDTKTGYITWQPVPIINYTAEVGGKVFKV